MRVVTRGKGAPVRLMRTSILFYLTLAFTGALIANPIAIDSEKRFYHMTAEKVIVNVNADHSRVTGDYVFALGKDFTPDTPDTYVEISVPVILKEKAVADYTVKWGNPQLRVQNHTIICQHRQSWSPVDSHSEDHVEYFETRVPLKMLSQRFEVHVSYIQPHLPWRVSAYLPMLPPAEGLPAEVRFQAGQKMRLRRVGGFSFLKPKVSELSFTPQDRKMIKVKAVRK